MKQPLALVLYEKLIPGSQLVNRLQDKNYRVMTVTDPDSLLSLGKAEKPLLIFADLVFESADVFPAITRLRRDPDTAHIPIIAFAEADSQDLLNTAQNAGAKLVVSEAALLAHLPQLLEQALHVE